MLQRSDARNEALLKKIEQLKDTIAAQDKKDAVKRQMIEKQDKVIEDSKEENKALAMEIIDRINTKEQGGKIKLASLSVQ